MRSASNLPAVWDAVGEMLADPKFDGRSLLPLLMGQATVHRVTLHWNEEGGEGAVRRGVWKRRAVGAA